MAVPSLRSAILGINRRNREFVYPLNPRAIRGLADDKAGAREILEEAGLPMPALYDRVETVARIPRTMDHLGARTEPFVVKPCRGSRGRGILMLRGDGEGGFRRLNGSTHPTKLVRRHLATILSGEFSMKAGMDEALIEEYIETESSLKTLFAEGAPDLRVLLHHGSPAMAMARIPTRRSDGRANLHQGALGVGIDLDTGQGLMGVHRETRIVDRHPDTNIPVTELSVPYWPMILELSQKAAQAIPLGYAGLDLMISAARGPLVIEINAHPGLAIQLANGRGLRPRLMGSKDTTKSGAKNGLKNGSKKDWSHS